ncbi:MAG: TfoX/Sxy family protein [Pseudomonadota bacterium]
MAYDEAYAAVLRDRLAGHAGITERHMFGGLSFMLNGNMACGVHGQRVMFRVGKAQQDAALLVPGTLPLSFTKRPMGGMVEADAEILDDPDRLNRLMGLAVGFAGSLPPK